MHDMVYLERSVRRLNSVTRFKKNPSTGKMAINQFSCLSLNEKKSLLVCYLVPSLILITEAMGFDID